VSSRAPGDGGYREMIHDIQVEPLFLVASLSPFITVR
jgi:hypothetical protein